jgi:predicted  nucleic acid-binding Zn-ribbon protein
MSHEYYYETVMREQEQLESRLEDYRFQKERLEWQLEAVKNDMEKIQALIVSLEKQLGDKSSDS